MGSCRMPESDSVDRSHNGPVGYENDSIGSSFAVEKNIVRNSCNPLIGDKMSMGILPRVANRLFRTIGKCRASIFGRWHSTENEIHGAHDIY